MNINNVRNLNLNLLVSLKILLDTRHISKSAEKMNVSQSAMSHSLKKLREVLGDLILIENDKRELELSSFARTIKPKVDKLLVEINDIFYNSNQTSENSKKEITIGMPDYIEITLLPKTYNLLLKKHPEIRINTVHMNNITNINQFVSGEIDYCIGMFKSPPKDLKKKVLFKDYPVIAMSKNNTMANFDEFKMSDLLSSSLTLPGYGPDVFKTYIYEHFAKKNIYLNVSIVSSNLVSCLHHVLNSNLVTITLPNLLNLSTYKNSFRCFPLPFKFKPYQCSLYWHPQNKDSIKDTLISLSAT